MFTSLQNSPNRPCLPPNWQMDSSHRSGRRSPQSSRKVRSSTLTVSGPRAWSECRNEGTEHGRMWRRGREGGKRREGGRHREDSKGSEKRTERRRRRLFRERTLGPPRSRTQLASASLPPSSSFRNFFSSAMLGLLPLAFAFPSDSLEIAPWRPTNVLQQQASTGRRLSTWWTRRDTRRW